MQLLPDQQSARPTAIMLLVVAAIVVYLLMFHWFILRHFAYAEEISSLREQLARFEAVAGTRDAVEQRLQQIRDSRADANLFLEEGDFNEAAAAMSDRLGQMIRTQADTDCQIVSRQPVRPRVQERYEKVTVNVRMRCQLSDLLNILYRLESEVPMLIIDNLNIIKPRSRQRSRATGPTTELLDIRFNMSGYLNQ
ncbi:MAG: type II secretion system protein GspM [Xanthomonadales bacterium]|nr:type II secretion system protein GspM [Xanthomonadales bacterium]